MQQNSAPSDDDAQNKPQNDPLPPKVDSGEVSGESETSSKHDDTIKESVHTSMESTRGDGEADASTSATSCFETRMPIVQSAASERQARTSDRNTARKDGAPRQRSIPRFRGGGGSPRSPVAISKDFFRRLFDRKKDAKNKQLGSPYSSLAAETLPNCSDSYLPSDGKVSIQGSPNLLVDRTIVEQPASVSPSQRAGKSEADLKGKIRRASHQEVTSGNSGATGGSPRAKSSRDAVSAPAKVQEYEYTQVPDDCIPPSDGNRECKGERTGTQQHAWYSHAMTGAPLTMEVPQIAVQVDTKDAGCAHEQRPRVQPVHQQDVINGSSKSTRISRPASLPEIPRHTDQRSLLRSTPSVNPQLTLNTKEESKNDSKLGGAVQTTSRITSSSAISWSSSTTFCSTAPSRSSPKEASEVSSPSQPNQTSASSAQQQDSQPLQEITNDTRTASATPPRLAAATEADKPGTTNTGRVYHCSRLQRSNGMSSDGTVETCLNSPNTPPSGGASTNIVVGVKTTAKPTSAADATYAAPNATNARNTTFMAALMRGGGRGPRLDPDSIAPSEPGPAPRTWRGHSTISSALAPSVGPISATNASQTSSFGSPTFVVGCGGDHEMPEVSVSPAPCDYTGTSSDVGENDEDDGYGSNTQVDDMSPGVALASSCGSSPGTVAAAVAVEVTCFPSSLLRRVDVVRPAADAAASAPWSTTVAADRDVDIDMHVPSRTSSLSPSSTDTPAPKYPPVEEGETAAAEPAPPAATDRDATMLPQSSPLRPSLDQPIRSPKRQAKPWWESGCGSADKDFVTGSEGDARESGKGESGPDGRAFCGSGTGPSVWHGDGAAGQVEMTAARRKRDSGRRGRADRGSTGSWISME